jgi:hypothetical protein
VGCGAVYLLNGKPRRLTGGARCVELRRVAPCCGAPSRDEPRSGAKRSDTVVTLLRVARRRHLYERRETHVALGLADEYDAAQDRGEAASGPRAR